MTKIYMLSAMTLFFVRSFGQTNTFPVTGKVGIGTTNPQYQLQMIGGHTNTNLNLHYYTADPLQQAHLTLWASEPGWTYTGTGIGNNVYNSNSANGVVRISTVRGGSYMRLLDQEIRLNVIDLEGTNITALTVDKAGNIGIGTVTPKEKLSVRGRIRAEEVKVETANWPDYVFDANHQILSLLELENYIKFHKHLPEIPSAAEVKKDGIALGEMNKLLLKKIEELTLYLIEKDKEISELKKEQSKIADQESRIHRLEQLIQPVKKQAGL
ncbi:hypothetical protein [Pedobacter sp. FW305-3-2-15-E-R2A2]|uniref:hypothetical protein n=1 Tax=Pedobacter sp. FW305-3-2-15-E-R2A2 TaxID=3140251 RepID=UPI003140ABAA